MTEQIYQLFRESKGLSTDSRTISEGQMFLALWGNKFNGNKYAADALKKGASWAVIDDPAFETEKTILVDDTLMELHKLATHHRKELKCPVLAVTGSNGKTTTKELIAAVLSKKYRVHSTKRNLNNQIGVPLTILSAQEGTEIMVLEMGASHIGEIRTLCLIARPDYGIITNIGAAHMEGFGSIEGVAKAKTELYEHLRKVNGIAFYNDRDRLISSKIYGMVNRAVPFSDPAGTALKAVPEITGLNLAVNVKYRKKKLKVQTKLFGAYNADNVRAAMAVGLFFGVDIEDIADAIENYEPEDNRSRVIVTENNTLISDSYNANPVSMKLALESFAAIKAENKLCILGDMLELGDRTEEEHKKIHRVLTDHNLQNVMLTGPVFTKVSAGFRFKTFSSVGRLRKYLKLKPVKGYHILIKGSRGMALEQIYDVL
ncbi:MAG TPA: UDP-N-acetylmuramoyl-tripeptide--D-alanyl-D-alanine ligase [Bacteroidales bacterium]|nr:UDP-N-acetylmuramoyl-tripeptide--D-alanyl-D-alanine ligase [Bacteroidales bacterium]HQH24972.1 UDP-N-acetylmuramoyl-tripeptide--D-alanyl-D-alanine ligase [Bacteroidales bacterium]HQJ82617.1 UDP-N-acetylmuramoyl-tripeptide--D-alanyl-D-alanine ligase [Bacteroidales bacterium]